MGWNEIILGFEQEQLRYTAAMPSSSSASRFEREREEDGVGLERVRVVGQVFGHMRG